MSSEAELIRLIQDLFASVQPPSKAVPAVLGRTLRHFEAGVGTIHRLEAAEGQLRLVHQKGVLAPMLDMVQAIPVGKGLAGVAAERRTAVQARDLPAEPAKPGQPARAKEKPGSIAAPMFKSVSGEDRLFGVIGLAKPVPYEFRQDEIDLLLKIGRLIAEKIG